MQKTLDETIDELKGTLKQVWAAGLKDYCEAQRCSLGLCGVATDVEPEQARRIQRKQQAAWIKRAALLSHLQTTIYILEEYQRGALRPSEEDE